VITAVIMAEEGVMSVLVERDGRSAQRERRHEQPGAPVREALRTGRTVDRTRPPGRPRRVTAPHVVAAPRMLRPRPLPLVYLIVLGALVCAAVYGLGVMANSTASGNVPEHTVSVMIAPGQSLWSLAEQHAPNSDPTAVVDRIRDLNGLAPGTPIPVGTPLQVPDGH
jgi:hypothetical protein